jgi:hypothetical protein
VSFAEGRLHIREWLILAALSLLTICVLLSAAELFARWKFPTLKTVGEDCIISNDASTGARGMPNSQCWEKLPDGQLTSYEFNSCGHRAGMECGPKPPHTFRIVMIGSSFGMGMRVPREDSFAALLPQQLSQQLRHRIELYNQSMPFRTPHVFALHFDEVLAAQPDLILWVATPVDIQNEMGPTIMPITGIAPVAMPPDPAQALSPSASMEGLKHRILMILHDLWSQQRIGFLLRYFVYESPSRYVRSYLARGAAADYLKERPSEQLQGCLEHLEDDAAVISAKAAAAHVPVALVFLPDRAQVAMIAMNDWPAGFNPFSLGDRVRDLVSKHGIAYVDIFPDIRKIPSPERGYFSVDGHPNAYGHAVISRLIARQLERSAAATSGSASSLPTMLGTRN